MTGREIRRTMLLASFMGCVIGSVWQPGLAWPAVIFAVFIWFA